MNVSTPRNGWVRIMQYEGTRAPAVQPPAAGDLYGYIGQVAVAWGSFEADLNAFIDSMLHVTGGDPRLAHMGSFRTRKAEFRKQMAVVFADCPNIRATLDRMLGYAADIQWRRNILLHGVPASGYDGERAIIKQVGTHNGRTLELEFDEETLRQMLLILAQTHGLLDAIGEEPEPPSHERHRVREHLANAHPRGYRGATPNPDKRKHPPLSFRG